MPKGGIRWGAGRPGYRLKEVHTRSIDVRRWHRDGLLKGWYFGWQWSDPETGQQTASIGVHPGAHCVTLSYTVGGEQRQPTIGLTTTSCTFGGSRLWFQCPHCHARCAKLFLRGGHFACRKCQQISYQSQSEDEIGRMWRTQAKIENRLGDHLSRPKFMRHKTYERLKARLWQIEWARDEALHEFAVRLGLTL